MIFAAIMVARARLSAATKAERHEVGMRALQELERFGIAAVARHFEATWATTGNAGKGPRDVTLTIAGRRIAAAIVALRGNTSVPPRLRYDKVALRFMRDVEAALGTLVPRGKTVLMAISAPIKLASKTVAAVQERVQALLSDGSDDRDARAPILGNHIRVRILPHGAADLPKAIGFVHTAAANAEILLDAARTLLGQIAATAKARPTAHGAGERWLVLVDRDGAAAGAIYRHVVARLAAPVRFGKVLLVSDAGQVAALAE